MSKTKIIISATIVLELSPTEAYYIKSMVQNSLYENETVDESHIRKTIFELIPSFEELNKIK